MFFNGEIPFKFTKNAAKEKNNIALCIKDIRQKILNLKLH